MFFLHSLFFIGVTQMIKKLSTKYRMKSVNYAKFPALYNKNITTHFFVLACSSCCALHLFAMSFFGQCGHFVTFLCDLIAMKFLPFLQFFSLYHSLLTVTQIVSLENVCIRLKFKNCSMPLLSIQRSYFAFHINLHPQRLNTKIAPQKVMDLNAIAEPSCETVRTRLA